MRSFILLPFFVAFLLLWFFGTFHRLFVPALSLRKVTTAIKATPTMQVWGFDGPYKLPVHSEITKKSLSKEYHVTFARLP